MWYYIHLHVFLFHYYTNLFCFVYYVFAFKMKYFNLRYSNAFRIIIFFCLGLLWLLIFCFLGSWFHLYCFDKIPWQKVTQGRKFILPSYSSHQPLEKSTDSRRSFKSGCVLSINRSRGQGIYAHLVLSSPSQLLYHSGCKPREWCQSVLHLPTSVDIIEINSDRCVHRPMWWS